jgi:hypothetical protein
MIYECGERLWNDVDRRKLKRSEINLSQCDSVHLKSHIDSPWRELEPAW